jgi:hypothetical protein
LAPGHAPPAAPRAVQLGAARPVPRRAAELPGPPCGAVWGAARPPVVARTVLWSACRRTGGAAHRAHQRSGRQRGPGHARVRAATRAAHVRRRSWDPRAPNTAAACAPRGTCAAVAVGLHLLCAPARGLRRHVTHLCAAGGVSHLLSLRCGVRRCSTAPQLGAPRCRLPSPPSPCAGRTTAGSSGARARRQAQQHTGCAALRRNSAAVLKEAG